MLIPQRLSYVWGVVSFFNPLLNVQLGISSVLVRSCYLSRPHDLLRSVDGLSAAGTLLGTPELLRKLGRVRVGGASVRLRPEMESRENAIPHTSSSLKKPRSGSVIQKRSEDQKPAWP